MSGREVDNFTNELHIVHCSECVSAVASKNPEHVICVPLKSIVSGDYFCKYGTDRSGRTNEDY